MKTRLVARTNVQAVARASGAHPELVRRLVALGLADPGDGLDAAARIARVIRLRRDLGLNYAGAILAGDLLDRIDVLERRLRHYERTDPQRR
jgi:hypothetical protein